MKVTLTKPAQFTSLAEWSEWATNYGRNGGTCVRPHFRCHDDNFCDKCDIFQWCTVLTKKKRKIK